MTLTREQIEETERPVLRKHLEGLKAGNLGYMAKADRRSAGYKQAKRDVSIINMALNSIQGWQPMGTAPKDGTWIILYHKSARIGDWYWSGDCWENDVLKWREDEYGPTHFMPIPEVET